MLSEIAKVRRNRHSERNTKWPPPAQPRKEQVGQPPIGCRQIPVQDVAKRGQHHAVTNRSRNRQTGTIGGNLVARRGNIQSPIRKGWTPRRSFCTAVPLAETEAKTEEDGQHKY